jgi:uncharacterized membrane protein YeiB
MITPTCTPVRAAAPITWPPGGDDPRTGRSAHRLERRATSDDRELMRSPTPARHHLDHSEEPAATPLSVRVAAAHGSTPTGDRLVGPDLARGGMLLLIALANIHAFTHGFRPGYRGYPDAQSALDQVFTVAQMLLVDGRAFPLFAALLGYGLVQFVQRRAVVAPDLEPVRALRRRGAWLVAIGFVHAMLLFTADIIALYGLVALLFAGVVARSSDRRLLVAAAWLAVPATAFGAGRGLPASALGDDAVVTATALLLDGASWPELAARGQEWAINLLRVLGLAPAVLLGAWAGRWRALSTPALAPTLRRVALVGLVLGTAGGVPAALMAATVWTSAPTVVSLGAGALHLVSGYGVAAAYLALFALAAARTGRPGVLARPLVASGQRSMTLYLLQSVTLLVLTHPVLAGLGDDLGIALLSAVAVGVWLLGVLLAVAMHAAGVRGPAEIALRRLAGS